MQTARNQREHRLQRQQAWVKDGVRLEVDPHIEWWPIRGVTGTIAQQRRDDVPVARVSRPLLVAVFGRPHSDSEE